MKDSATIINGKRYLESKEVCLDENGPRYREYLSADIMNPEVIYVATDVATRGGGPKKGEVLDEDSATYTALREKYTDKDLLYGDFKLHTIDRRSFIKGISITGVGVAVLGIQSCKKEETFFESSVLNQLFENDIKEFSANSAANSDIRQIFKSRNMGNPEVYYNNKLRGRAGYYYRREQNAAGTYHVQSDRITYRNVDETEKYPEIRGHEMGHKGSAEKINSSHYRVGFLVGKKKRGKWTYLGSGFDEGATERRVTININVQFDDAFIYSKACAYPDLAKFYQRILDKLGNERIMLEGYEFDPKVLEAEFNRRLKDKAAFATFLKETDEFHKLVNDKKPNAAQYNKVMQIISGL